MRYLFIQEGCFQRLYIILMKSGALPHLQPRNKERNQKIADILTLLITISAKIQKIKQKLCGFSSQQFSPECLFETLDLTSKGYLDLYDIKQFLSNDRIQEQDILRLFIRFGATATQPKLTYLGYLQLLKPHFSVELGRDLLLRDTFTRNMSGQKIARDTQQTILLLLNELILMNCICIAEHQQLKAELMQEYMLNELELKEILGLESISPLKAIYEFIEINSNFQVGENEVRYVLAYLRIPEFQLPQERVVASLFLPTHLRRQKESPSKRANYNLEKQKQKLYLNYDKKYIGRQDLLNNSQKISFLNYIHPNSYQQPQIPTRQPTSGRKYQSIQDNVQEQKIGSQHGELNVFNDQRMKKSLKQLKKIQPQSKQNEMLEESSIQPANEFKSLGPARLLSASQLPFQTPILEKFMHESNVRNNIGQYIPNPNPQKLNILMQQSVQSHMSNSEAFQRPPRAHTNINIEPQRQQKQPFKKDAIIQSKEQIISPQQSQLRKKQYERLGISGAGILDQFIRQDLG